jgi:hypothetical protein
LYGPQMYPAKKTPFAKPTMSWEFHLSRLSGGGLRAYKLRPTP